MKTHHFLGATVLAGALAAPGGAVLAQPVIAPNPTATAVVVVNTDPKIAPVPQTGRRADAIRARLRSIRLPPGFKIDLFAVVPDAHRIVASSTDYSVFVGTRKSTLWVLLDPEGEAKPDAVQAFVPSLKFDMPDGLCFTLDGFLVVVERNRVRTISTTELADGGSLSRVVEVVPQGQLLPVSEISADGSRACRIGPDKKLYIAIGQSSVPSPSKSKLYERYGIGGVTRLDPFLGSGREMYASGVFNAGGLEFNPKDGSLWFTDDSVEGEDVSGAGGEINQATTADQFFGFPWVQGRKRTTDKRYRNETPPPNAVEPQVYTEPGGSNQGLAFYTGMRFPAKYRGGLFTVQRGSTAHGASVDARVLFTSLKPDGTADRTEVFAEGWLDPKTKRFRGRPVDLTQLFDGSLLISDDMSGAVYRITYDGP